MSTERKTRRRRMRRDVLFIVAIILDAVVAIALARYGEWLRAYALACCFIGLIVILVSVRMMDQSEDEIQRSIESVEVLLGKRDHKGE